VCFRVWGALLGFPFLLARLVEGLCRLSHKGEGEEVLGIPSFLCGVGACVLPEDTLFPMTTIMQERVGGMDELGWWHG